jgi:hypothetical protein
MQVLCLYTDPKILDFLSHAFGLLVEFKPENFKRISQLGLFESYFSCLEESLNSKVHSMKPKGIYYFLQNYYFTMKSSDPTYFQITFPYIMQMIQDMDNQQHPELFFNMVQFTHHLIEFSVYEDFLSFVHVPIFTEFLNIIRQKAFDLE